MIIREFLLYLIIFHLLSVCVANNDYYHVFDCNNPITILGNDTLSWKLQLQNNTVLVVRNCIKTLPGILAQCLDHCFDNLNILDICHNNLTNIPTNAFISMKKISVINMCHNNLSHVELNLSKDSCIEKLNLSSNTLESAPLLRGCFSELILNQNRLINIDTKLICQNCEHLVKLSLSHNSFKKVEGNTFDALHNLSELILDHNNLNYLDKNAFQTVKRLETLDLSYNLLESLNDELFNGLDKLKVLHLDNNKLSHLGKDCFKTTKDLEYVDLSGNNIGFPYYSPREPPPTIFHANILWFVDLTEKAAARSYPTLQVNLSRNNIQEMNLNFPYKHVRGRHSSNNTIKVDLYNNPINCDCGAYDLIKYSQAKLGLIDIKTDHLVCVRPPQYENIPLQYIDIRDISCDTTNQPYCPLNCKCRKKIELNTAVIDCKQRNLTSLSTVKLPTDVGIELYLANNSISDIGEFLLNNKLANITVLSLSHNNLSHVPEHLELLRTLEILQLDGNRLEYLGKRYLLLSNFFPIIRAITLGRNPWKCNCSITSVITILTEHKDKIMDMENIKCADSNVNINTLSRDEVCPNENHLFVTQTIIGTTVVLFVGVILIVIHYFKKKYMKDIQVILSPHCEIHHDVELQSKKFDAFISYSHLDEAFVEQHLVPNLEKEPYKFKICIHHRHFIPGKFITDEIVKSVEESRKTVIVLSNNYLASSWSTFEFQTAFLKMIHKRNHELIVIMFKEIDLNNDKISPSLKAYLQTRTYLEVHDPIFWNKLRTALEN